MKIYELLESMESVHTMENTETRKEYKKEPNLKSYKPPNTEKNKEDNEIDNDSDWLQKRNYDLKKLDIGLSSRKMKNNNIGIFLGWIRLWEVVANTWDSIVEKIIWNDKLMDNLQKRSKSFSELSLQDCKTKLQESKNTANNWNLLQLFSNNIIKKLDSHFGSNGAPITKELNDVSYTISWFNGNYQILWKNGFTMNISHNGFIKTTVIEVDGTTKYIQEDNIEKTNKKVDYGKNIYGDDLWEIDPLSFTINRCLLFTKDIQ